MRSRASIRSNRSVRSRPTKSARRGLQKRNRRRVLESGGAVAGLATAAFLCSACMSPPSEAGARLADVYQQAAQMELALDSLEERLLGLPDNAALKTWSKEKPRR